MAIQGLGATSPAALRQKDPIAELRDAANRAVMNKELEEEKGAPAGLDAKRSVSLPVSQRDQREHGVVSRAAYAVDGQLYIQDTVMTPQGDTQEVWKRGKRALPA